jgi:hypothetical protein
MTDDSKVVFLAFSNPVKTLTESITFTACKSCRNKTFTLIHDADSTFPRLNCAACGQNMGRMGYAPDEDK